MTIQMDIREESPADHSAIYALTEVAFRDRPYAGGDEQDVITRLRDAGALSLSLVATEVESQSEDELKHVIGQITFSPAQLAGSDKLWMALGPVSVLPEYQGRGVGSALIIEGLKRMQSLGASGCILTGNPDYYKRFGFEFSAGNVPPNEPAEFFMLNNFGEDIPVGAFAFHDAFYGEM